MIYTLHATKNCSTCEYKTTTDMFPYVCSLTNEMTGELMKCKKWKEEKHE